MRGPIRHVVWDWNGTLFDDFPILVRAASEALVALGGHPISEATYRERFRRPIHLFYEEILGREITEGEWAQVDDVFHAAYDELAHETSLAHDAELALAAVGERGRTQSVLSMWRHERLTPFVAAIGVDAHFVRVEGLADPGGGHKAPHLAAHVAMLVEHGHVDHAAEVLLIGDTVDDGRSAREVGTSCVLYTGGEHPPDRLEAEGYPVVRSLMGALRVAGLL